MDVEPTVCLSTARPSSTPFVLLQKRKRELAPGYIWMDEETGVFLSLMQGDKTTIGYFN